MTKAKAKRPTSRQLDPSQTYSLRRLFMREMRRRFERLASAVDQYVASVQPVTMNAYAFATDAEKTLDFQQWLEKQVNDGILVVHGDSGKPWTAKYVEAAHKRGAFREYARTHKLNKEQRDFIKSSFYGPTMMSKVEALSIRAFETLRGITTDMSHEMNQIFAMGIIEGKGAMSIARDLRNNIDSFSSRRALVLARTEVIRAHAEGQLDGIAALGGKEVVAEVEWSTADDSAVCEQCTGMSGEVYQLEKAHNLIPLHPNCRCAWAPVVESAQRAVR